MEVIVKDPSINCVMSENGKHWLLTTYEKPEQVCMCRMELNWDYDGDCPAYYRDYVCSECKEDFIYYKNSRVSYCPNCGARVVEANE